MVLDRKRKKHHDKDKYYRLAKEQGLRSRAAFKLSQINRKYTILEKASTAVLDLCAAPGGWTQIASRTCLKTTSIIAVDILPIRPISGSQHNVTTLIGDITTDKCKADIKRCLQNKEFITNDKNNRNNSTTNNGNVVDVVLHDGAPNIGADYSKDAYVQNEMVVHALKVACTHLKSNSNSTFITKVYRSRDYSSIVWLLQQFFYTVTTYKPKASREQSSEIFLICTNYKAPNFTSIDTKLFDPKYVFEHVDNVTTGSDMKLAGIGPKGNMTIFDKNWNKHYRQRGGYDTDYLNFNMRHDENILDFIDSTTSTKDAISMLSRCTGFTFIIDTNSKSNTKTKKKDIKMSDNDKDEVDEEDDDDEDNSNELQELSTFVQNHPLTTIEIKESLADLQVLNKGDFKSLLQWRIRMQDAIKERIEQLKHDADDQDNAVEDDDNDDTTTKDGNKGKENDELDSDAEEEVIQGEIEAMKLRRQKERKKKIKKERAVVAKRRRQAALGMDLNAFDINNDNDFAANQQIFTLATIQSKHALQIASEVNLDTTTDEQIFGTIDEQDDDIVIDGTSAQNDSDNDDNTNTNTKLTARRQRELDEAYDLYLQTTKDGLAKAGTKMAKRSKKLQREKVINETVEDNEMIMNTDAGLSYDKQTYANILTKSRGNDDDEDSDDDDSEDGNNDGYNDEPMTPEEHEVRQKKLQQVQLLQDAHSRSKMIKGNNKNAATKDDRNPLIHEFVDDEPVSAKTSRWFSNPLFASIGKAVADSTTTTTSNKRKEFTRATAVSDDSDDDNDNDTKSNMDNKITAEDVLALMPKTDKQKRHDKRLKTLEKDQRKEERRKKRLGDTEGDVQVVPSEFYNNNNNNNDEEEDDNGNIRLKPRNKKDEQNLSESKKKKILEAQELIKAGMGVVGGSNKGTSNASDKNNNTSIEIVPQDKIQDRPMPVLDDRKYDSDNMDYDSDDYAETMAIGTMIVRSKSKEKALVDASYNRYSWNDPEQLPDWFIDDEKKHYRPQLPIPPALLAKMKEQMLALSVKPIKKVAEARARKNKRAKLKLSAAKKKAEAVAQSTDMSEAMKLRAISKALQSGKSSASATNSKKSSKQQQFVVAKKGRSIKGAKGVKVVDKRLLCDTRATKRIEKKKKNGGKIIKKRGRR